MKRFAVGACIFSLLLLYYLPPSLPDNWPQSSKNAMGLVSSVLVLWATEALPLSATALLIPLPAVLIRPLLLQGSCSFPSSPSSFPNIPCDSDATCLQVFRHFTLDSSSSSSPSPSSPPLTPTSDEKDEFASFHFEKIEGAISCILGPIPPQQAAKQVASLYFSPMSFQFLGIFSIASAMKKTGLDQKLASLVLRYAGSNPRTILLGVMLLGWFLSMWITNVAAAVVLLSLVSPLFPSFEHDSFSKCLLLGIAYSCNISGMASTIASPQNLLANSALENAGHEPISFAQWLVVGGVTSFLGTLAAYAFLLVFFRPGVKRVGPEMFYSEEVRIGKAHLFVLGITFSVIGIWCLGSVPGVKKAFGDVALLGAIPVACFLGANILSKADFLLLPWDIIVLVGGGLSLGFIVTSSKLLGLVTYFLKMAVGNDPVKTIWTFGLFTWVFSNFISHTVAAAIIMPVIATSPHARLAVLLATLLDSGACALPVSGFPNALAYAQKDSQGRPYLETSDYLKTGVPVGIIMILIVNSVGNLLALMVGV